MSEEFENGPEFSPDCAPVIANVLTCVLALAVKDAVTAKPDAAPATDRLETLRQKLLSEAKSVVSDGAPYDMDAKGVAEATTIIEWVCKCVREQI